MVKKKYYRLQHVKRLELVNVINISTYRGKQSLTSIDKSVKKRMHIKKPASSLWSVT